MLLSLLVYSTAIIVGIKNFISAKVRYQKICWILYAVGFLLLFIGKILKIIGI